jgi:transposase InsO family protein
VPWREVSAMSMRREFVMLAAREGANRRELCRRYGISPTTGYKWLARNGGREEGLADRSRRPQASPGRTTAAMEGLVLGLRERHPAWGGRKLRRRLLDLGHNGVPSASTITAILRRHGRINPADAARHAPWQRFERAEPNELWQMDFKGHFALDQGRCHPLTVLDDCSRFALGLEALPDEAAAGVQNRLAVLFRRHGLPQAMLADNGRPWGACGEAALTGLEVWLILLGVRLCHGRPRHPQTQGKDERFQRTLMAECVGRRRFGDLADCQKAFEHWRHVYNHERPHQALGLDVPARRYHESPRVFPERLEPFDYGPSAVVRKVQNKGVISFQNRPWRVGKALVGQAVALRPTATDGVHDVVFCHQRVTQIDLNDQP